MPKAPAGSSSSPVKSEPYPPQSPTKSGKAGGGKGGAIFTDEIDRQIMNHVLSISDINLRYNWPDLAKSGLSQFTPKQASPRLSFGLLRIILYRELIIFCILSRYSSKVAGTIRSRTLSFRPR
jgi:hypothetical protein